MDVLPTRVASFFVLPPWLLEAPRMPILLQEDSQTLPNSRLERGKGYAKRGGVISMHKRDEFHEIAEVYSSMNWALISILNSI